QRSNHLGEAHPGEVVLHRRRPRGQRRRPLDHVLLEHVDQDVDELLPGQPLDGFPDVADEVEDVRTGHCRESSPSGERFAPENAPVFPTTNHAPPSRPLPSPPTRSPFPKLPSLESSLVLVRVPGARARARARRRPPGPPPYRASSSGK